MLVLLAIIAILVFRDWIPVHPSFSFYWAVFLPLIATTCGIAIEMWAVGYENSSIRQIITAHDDHSTGYDVFFYLVHLLGIWAWLPLFVSLGLNTYGGDFHDALIEYSESTGFSIKTGIFLSDLILLALLWTFFDYCNHRILHQQPIWYFHRMHHSATNLTLFTATRNNPIAYLVEPFLR
ncbi:MAG: sterol desaturase family protein, partial [Alphaproteobacteria bacterium]|nr:sterol desaturase family protein [Alphaproteobacteria bacterium]